MNLLRLWFFVCFVSATLAGSRLALAHPMGNFSINHYARFSAQSGELRLRYILDFAEIPAADQMAKLDSNGDNVISAAEKSAYLKSVAPQFLNGLSLQIDDKKIGLLARKTDLEVRPGAGGLPTLLVTIDAATPLPQGAPTRVIYEDSNFAGRTGWKEILAVASQGLAIANSDAGTQDQSRELTIFPIDAGVVPPRQDSAQFSVVAANASGAVAAMPDATIAPAPTTGNANRNTPQNRFTQSIAEKTLTPTVMLWGLLFAFAFGAVHALAPGHGKTMVAAYLVGSRGTPRHAVTLGLIVTLTHTFGVFVLGFAFQLISRYILPEKLVPISSALSGLLIFGVGLWLFMSRYQGLQNAGGHSHAHDGHSHDGHTHSHGAHSHSHDEPSHVHSHDEHDHDEEHAPVHGAHSHAHDEEHAHSHAHDEEHALAHAHDEEHALDDEEHSHAHGAHSHSHDEGEQIHAHGVHAHSHDDHDHAHSHDEEEHSHAHGAHDHDHSHDEGDHTHAHGVHVHSHGGKAHSHAIPTGPITTKTLVALGVSGGIVPCPEALVVLLAAVKLHRIGYGMILIVAFSIGLAAALIAIGMLVVSARQHLTRFNALGEDSALVRYLPLGSAAVITLIGAALTLQATLGGF